MYISTASNNRTNHVDIRCYQPGKRGGASYMHSSS
ncbi:Uncharacterized protein APZ42_016692 [Daphnia magna]|uniref:Uncharacterized protein n=1 Tax=Daphnia magna TaxID=35525 RepID=A0A165A2W7_9CRUS|nr:Uncharacterized protein APZ42_016692 [Daphnia magna]